MSTIEEISAHRAAQLSWFARLLVEVFGTRLPSVIETQIRLGAEQCPSASDVWRLLGSAVAVELEAARGRELGRCR